MKKAFKIVVLVLILAVLAGSAIMLSACNKQDENKEKLVVGLECGYIPFNFTQQTDANGGIKISNADGYANGYDVIIAKRIADALGKELVIVKTEWDSLVPGVSTGTLDLVIAGMSPTAQRRESIDFSNAYYESNLVIVVRKDGAYTQASNLDDFSGAKIVAQQGTFHEKALQEQGKQHGITVGTSMATFPEMTIALNAKTIDGYVAEEPGAIADCAANEALTFVHLTNNDTGFTASAEDTQIAIGMRYGFEHKDAVNNILAGISQEERLAIMQDAVTYSTDNTTAKSTFFSRIGNIIKTYYLSILKGVGYTILVAIVGTVAGLFIGLLIGMYRTLDAPKTKCLPCSKNRRRDFVGVHRSVPRHAYDGAGNGHFLGLCAHQRRQHYERHRRGSYHRFNKHGRVYGGNRQRRHYINR